jgi:hypothetical protein
MSYIDTFDHEFVGFFGGLPIYHPVEVVLGVPDDPRDFGCDPSQLVIGGGGGEHPGLVIKEPENAAARFVISWLDRLEDDDPEAFAAGAERFAAWDAAHRDATFRPWSEVLEFAGWRVGEYSEFVEHCRSAAFATPYRPEKHRSVEAWISCSIGEFILLAMPEFAPLVVASLGAPVPETKWWTLFENVRLPPPGYPVFGRTTRDGRVNWGRSAWRIERIGRDDRPDHASR